MYCVNDSNWSAVSLIGQTAPPEVLQKFTYLVIRHPQVKRVDTVRAYTFGVLYFVEVRKLHGFLHSFLVSYCMTYIAVIYSPISFK